MIGDTHRLTPGYVARHVPPASGLGIDVAILDIAQDFLLAHLAEAGVFEELVVFKGGTALRKFFAGPEGRFSTDLDLASVEVEADREAVAGLIAEHANVALGPFRFEPNETRRRWHVHVRSEFGDPPITMKLEVGPPCWLRPEERPFVETSTQARYNFTLPRLPMMRLEEILAEKIARLSRLATARDAYDLVWARTTSPHSRFSPGLVRRLAVLKTWVDNHGLAGAWSPALSPRPFDPDALLSARDRWDDEQIGSLTHPPPGLEELEWDLATYYGWLRDLPRTSRGGPRRIRPTGARSSRRFAPSTGVPCPARTSTDGTYEMNQVRLQAVPVGDPLIGDVVEDAAYEPAGPTLQTLCPGAITARPRSSGGRPAPRRRAPPRPGRPLRAGRSSSRSGASGGSRAP